jgi:bifunctional DNA primase/polymerase-like protein
MKEERLIFRCLRYQRTTPRSFSPADQSGRFSSTRPDNKGRVPSIVISDLVVQHVTQARARGWSVIPTAIDKKPLLASWKEFQKRQPTSEEVETWFKRESAAFAVVTGAVSGVVVLDFDGATGQGTLQRLGLKPHVRSGGGGHHVYIGRPGWHVSTLNHKSKRALAAQWPGLDIRRDGGYAVFCGRNRNGDYQWLRNPIPDHFDLLPL